MTSPYRAPDHVDPRPDQIHRGPRVLCPRCENSNPYWLRLTRCAASSRVKLGWFLRCSDLSDHTHQTCSVCDATWTYPGQYTSIQSVFGMHRATRCIMSRTFEINFVLAPGQTYHVSSAGDVTIEPVGDPWGDELVREYAATSILPFVVCVITPGENVRAFVA